MYNLNDCTINSKHSYLLEYYSKIKSGEIIVGHELIQQLKNLIEDLDNPIYIFDNHSAEFRISFIEKFCKHTKSPFFGKPFKLDLWEKAFIESFYSFKWAETKLRRFKKAILLIARKNGKSTLCAAISLAEFFCGTGGNDIVCSSNDDAQAGIIFDEIANMREWSKALAKRSHKNNKGIFNLRNKSTIKKMSEKTQKKEGRNIDVGVVDEVHEMKDNTAVKPIEQSQSTKDEPILFLITTEGFVNNGFLDGELKYARKVLDKELEDPTLLIWLYTQDSEAEIWQDRESWYKSNPSLGIVKKFAYLEDQIRKAQQSKSDRAFTLAKDFNIKQNNSEAWLMPEDYENVETFDISEFQGGFAIGGSDLSRVGDLCSARALLMRKDDPKKYFYQQYFIPEAKLSFLKGAELEKYKKWIDDGFITISPGAENDFRLVSKWYYDLWKNYGIRFFNIGYDRWSATYFIQDLNELGFDTTKVKQDHGTLSEPYKMLERDFKAKYVVYSNNPIDKFCLGNASVDLNKNREILIVKPEGEKDKKIDGAVTMGICYRVYMDNRPIFLDLVNNN